MAGDAVVLGPVPRVDLDRPVIALEWQRDLLNLRGAFEAVGDSRIDVDVGRGVPELRPGPLQR